MSETTEGRIPSSETFPSPILEFSKGDYVELFDPPGGAVVFGWVLDPTGIDVEISVSLNPAFELGKVYRGIEEKDLRKSSLEEVQRIAEVVESAKQHVEMVEDDVEPGDTPTDMAQIMAADIKGVLGDELTLERCEAAIKMTQAARDYLAARLKTISFPDFSRFGPTDPVDNLKRLHQQIGIGDPDAV